MGGCPQQEAGKKIIFPDTKKRRTSSEDQTFPKWKGTTEDTCQRCLLRRGKSKEWCTTGLRLGTAAVPDLCKVLDKKTRIIPESACWCKLIKYVEHRNQLGKSWKFIKLLHTTGKHIQVDKVYVDWRSHSRRQNRTLSLELWSVVYGTVDDRMNHHAHLRKYVSG